MDVRERADRGAGTHRASPRVVPAAAVALVVLGLLALWTPVRHQLAVSFARQPESYVELYFAGGSPAAACADPGTAAAVRVEVRSHLPQRSELAWTVTARAGGRSLAARQGRVATVPGGTSVFGTSLPVPLTATAYDLDVRLTGRSERLLVHCGADS